MEINSNQKKQGVLSTIWENKSSFFLNLFVILSVTFAILYFFGLVPTELKSIVGREPVKESVGMQKGELPIGIKIPIVGVDAPVYNPSSTSIKVLDDTLLKGAVHYPGSGLLGGGRNVFIFAHNSTLAIVNNQAFKTFNGLKNLKPGDLVSVFSSDNEYVYRVLSLRMDKADNIKIDFNLKDHLTLTTCALSFGDKAERYIAEAEFVSQKPIVNQ